MSVVITRSPTEPLSALVLGDKMRDNPSEGARMRIEKFIPILFLFFLTFYVISVGSSVFPLGKSKQLFVDTNASISVAIDGTVEGLNPTSTWGFPERLILDLLFPKIVVPDPNNYYDYALEIGIVANQYKFYVISKHEHGGIGYWYIEIHKNITFF